MNSIKTNNQLNSLAKINFDPPNKLDDEAIKIYNYLAQIIISDKTFNDKEHDINIYISNNEHYMCYYCLAAFYETNDRYIYANICYQICIKIHPFIDAYLNLANIHLRRDDTETYLYYNKLAYKIDKLDFRVLNNLLTYYYLKKDFYVAYEYGLQILHFLNNDDSNNAVIYSNIGMTCMSISNHKDALKYYKMGMDVNINNIKICIQLLQNYLLCHDYIYDITYDPFIYNKINNIYKYQSNKYKVIKHNYNKLRIGFVSPDLNNHVVSFFMLNILEQYNRDKYKVYCYYNSEINDEISSYISKLSCINWINIYKLDDKEASDLIYDHNINILIDLTGHTFNNRLGIFLLKPAPVQISYLGYPNTTGLKTIDYRITDKYADPEDTTQYYSEKLIRMPNCFLSFKNIYDVALTEKHKFTNNIVFGIFNKIHKQSEECILAWNHILKALPNAVMIIKKDIVSEIDIDKLYSKKFSEVKNQIIMLNKIPGYGNFLEIFNDIDICLDTFPYSGTTTTCDTLYMSTPIITLSIKDRHVSNVSKSILLNMDLPELVAYSIDDYVNKAVELANDINQIKLYKSSIRQQFLKLMEPQPFVNNFYRLIEDTYDKH